MTKIILLGILLLLILGTGWWQYNQSTQPAEESTVQTTVATQPAVDSSINVYRNEEWGFQFEYPEGWEVREPAFGSASSLFNLAIEPSDKHNVEVVILNITPKDWIEAALVKIKARGIVIEDVIFLSRNVLRMEDRDSLSRPAMIILVPIKEEYWMNITGVKGYEKELNQILNSFQFLE